MWPRSVLNTIQCIVYDAVANLIVRYGRRNVAHPFVRDKGYRMMIRVCLLNNFQNRVKNVRPIADLLIQSCRMPVRTGVRL